MILAPITAMLNAGKGNGDIPHWQHIAFIICLGIIFADPLWICVTIMMTIFPTGNLFSWQGIAYGFIRSMAATIPAFLLTQNPWVLILLAWGILFRIALYFNPLNGVRWAEFIGGYILGLLSEAI